MSAAVRPLPGIPLVVVLDTDASRALLAKLHAGCDCPRLARYLPGWPHAAAVAAVVHQPPCRPTPLLEPRLVILRATSTPPATPGGPPTRSW